MLPSIGVGGGTPIEIQTKVYDVLQAAVTVIWCIWMVVLFVDVVIIIRRFLPRYEETRLARPAVFYTCAVIGGLSGLVAVIATLSGSWTRPRRVLQALPNRPNGQRHKSARHKSIGQPASTARRWCRC